MTVTSSLSSKHRNARLPVKGDKAVKGAPAAAPTAHDFDPGYGWEPFRTLCNDYPGTDVYPNSDFRTEWGPLFHRGRLDGTARLLVIGQDPAAHEAFVRRILVGEAGQRMQGFMRKLGITDSYVLINTFLYSVFGQAGGNAHAADAKIGAYRNRWIDAILSTSPIEAVVALGGLADKAWKQWKQTPNGQTHPKLAYMKITHPTADAPHPGADPVAATKALLLSWNAGLAALRPAIKTPDAPADLTLYGETWKAADLGPIPERDYPAGLPSWMRQLDPWAVRGVPADAPKDKRRVLTVIVPEGATS